MSDLECSIHGEHESNECYECEWDDLRAQLQAEREAREKVQLESDRHARACAKAVETLVVAEKQRDAATERAERAEYHQGVWETTVECHRVVIGDLEAERDALRALVRQSTEALVALVAWCDANDWGCVPKDMEANARAALNAAKELK